MNGVKGLAHIGMRGGSGQRPGLAGPLRRRGATRMTAADRTRVRAAYDRAAEHFDDPTVGGLETTVLHAVAVKR